MINDEYAKIYDLLKFRETLSIIEKEKFIEISRIIAKD